MDNNESNKRINVPKVLLVFCFFFIICGYLIVLTPTFIQMMPGSNLVKTHLNKKARDEAKQEAIKNHKSYLRYHPKATTLTTQVVSKTFAPKDSKYSSTDEMQNVSRQASGYIKSIKNIKDYTVQVNTTGNGFFAIPSKTVTLNRK